MQIKKAIEKVPGGLMVVPLLLGALLNSVDQMHLEPVQTLLESLGAAPAGVQEFTDPQSGETASRNVYEFLEIGGFTSALFKKGALTLIGMFLVCVGAQMDFRVGGIALKKGLIVTSAKLGMAIVVGYSIGALFDPFGQGGNAFLGLSMVAIIAAMENGNGGLYAALTGEYGNHSDMGAISVISLNDGPFFTLAALGMLGEQFPLMAFAAVLIPMAVGFALGNLDNEMRVFLKLGEQVTIPFFAFALGAGMNLANFFNLDVLYGGLFLGVATLLCTGIAGTLLLRLFGEKSQIAAWAEGSTAGNAAATPLAIATAAAHGGMSPERVAQYQAIVENATAQVSISTITTALLCPVAVILWDRWQKSRGIDAREE